ncbi:DDE-type integrase/transposase/recombinase [Brevibacterium casei]|uniref:Transposase of ISAar27, IS481 family protein n=4 Tax=Brevibacterium casei TaxID=33889 RepID=K9ADH5_9MICO|nr:DDE-type integrase/transposase/recombinase [Brevibacterium casei]EKU45334.1 transposase of ISAar27, IS481 family protein [Brevibacterium casei S18]MCT1551439.1 DDE-type integrase/transposase/recombinase [Brevibacterium casei]MCT1561905.1 DDE-type integrase/transposase/recombinase [Brevibacterium casei]MCT2209160.1 DDE-type integrase/transposase/recombinase [Brevibacterium casei]QPR39197.1 transposase [Brevibacterium casei]
MADRITTHLRRKILAHKPSETDTVTAFCHDNNISRDSYYRIRNEQAPLQAGSTAPRRPHTIYPDLTWELIRQYRHELAEAGYDDGPRSIKWTLIRNDHPDHLIPSTSRIGMFLRQEGLTRLNPKKRPHSSYKRFQKAFANELWQLDGFEYRLDAHTVVTIIQTIDDCTRMMTALDLAPGGETAEATLAILNAAIAEYGKPREILSDNSRAFTLQRSGMVGTIDAAMAAQGIIMTPGPYYRPRNQGKVERAHKPVIKRLKATRPRTRADIQAILNDFQDHYNHHRQHQGLRDGLTPAAAWQAATTIDPPTEPIDPHALVDRYATTDDRGHLSFEHTVRRLHKHGFILFRKHPILFGMVWEGHELMIIDKGSHLEFYLIPHGELVAILDLPLPETKSLNITRDGRFVNGDNLRLPAGVEDRRKSRRVSDK